MTMTASVAIAAYLLPALFGCMAGSAIVSGIVWGSR